jgi:enoyl-CoA hydratase/carnithine racemase
MTDTVVCIKEGYVARLVLNNRAKHNALGEQELVALQGHLMDINQDANLRVLVVTSHGDETFCAGADLGQLQSGLISPELFQDTTNLLAGLRVPTICAINGNLFGGGVELALACDFRIGLVGTRMQVPAAKIGLCYPLSGINRFVERMGVNIAKRMLVAAEVFEAAEMLHIGFLHHLVEPGQLEHQTQELVDSITALAPLAVQAMKEILQQAAGGQMNQKRAMMLAHACAVSEDLQEGFIALKEKRSPRFHGR